MSRTKAGATSVTRVRVCVPFGVSPAPIVPPAAMKQAKCERTTNIEQQTENVSTVRSTRQRASAKFRPLRNLFFFRSENNNANKDIVENSQTNKEMKKKKLVST